VPSLFDQKTLVPSLAMSKGSSPLLSVDGVLAVQPPDVEELEALDADEALLDDEEVLDADDAPPVLDDDVPPLLDADEPLLVLDDDVPAPPLPVEDAVPAPVAPPLEDVDAAPPVPRVLDAGLPLLPQEASAEPIRRTAAGRRSEERCMGAFLRQSPRPVPAGIALAHLN
jgi:hypothetical protein